MLNRFLRAILALELALIAPITFAADESPAHAKSPRPAFNSANYSGGSGLSKATAVVLKIASDSGGIASEYTWVEHTYPGAKVLEQALSTWDHGKRYDILTMQTADKTTIGLWFDISLMYK